METHRREYGPGEGDTMKKRAFTLIELLVVIAIIAILAAILFPVFAKARERAMLTTCINNNKQLGTAFAMYIGDTDGRLPAWADGSSGAQSYATSMGFASYTWDVAIFTLVKTKRSFTCPSNRSSEARQAPDSDPVRSYAMPQNISALNQSQIKAPAQAVLLYEKGTSRCGVGSDATGEYFGQTADGATDITRQNATDPTKWHMFHGTDYGQGKVFLFADGHAKFFQAIPKTQNNNNPFGYYFPGPGLSADGQQHWPSGPAGYGYCGSADGFHAGGPTVGGANLPY